MQKTSNYGLKKPDGTDVVNVEDLNYNADIIDKKLKEVENSALTGSVASDSKVSEIDQKIGLVSDGASSLTLFGKLKQIYDSLLTRASQTTADAILTKVSAPSYKIMKSKVWDVPGTYSWIVPAGVTEVYITGCAGGAGGGGGANNQKDLVAGDGGSGGAGGITSFGSLLSLVGGAGGAGGYGGGKTPPYTTIKVSIGGVGSGDGGKGGNASKSGIGGGGGGGYSTGGNGGGNGDGSGYSTGGGIGGCDGVGVGLDACKGGIGAGGGGGGSLLYDIGGTPSAGAGGGAGNFKYSYPVIVSPNQNIYITVGSGGKGGNGGISPIPGLNGGNGGNGGNGILTVKWWE